MAIQRCPLYLRRKMMLTLAAVSDERDGTSSRTESRIIWKSYFQQRLLQNYLESLAAVELLLRLSAKKITE